MNKNQVTQTKRTYVAPSITIVSTQTDQLMQHASGQHQHIGQGGSAGDAKRGFVFEDDEEDNPWETYTW